jgi:hypothetical protein
VQKYGKVPAVGNVWLKDPLDFVPESQSPLAVQHVPEVVECGPVAQFHVTVSPARIVVVALPLAESVNAKPPPAPTVTLWAAAGGGVGVVATEGTVGVMTTPGAVGEGLSLLQARERTTRKQTANAANRRVRVMVTSVKDTVGRRAAASASTIGRRRVGRPVV